MDTEVYKIRIDQWRKLIYEANTCGMKKTEWCRQNGVTIKQFYYWQKKISIRGIETACTAPYFIVCLQH